MLVKSTIQVFSLILTVFCSTGTIAAQDQSLSGTLVVAVPIDEGVVVCSDKRMFNRDAGTFTDSFVKIRKVSDNALFAATNTVGFYDARTKTVAFDAFEVTAGYAGRHPFEDTPKFWGGLTDEIRGRLRQYFKKRNPTEWPESDRENNNLLFNVVFYSLDGERVRGHTLKVFYEKAATPKIYFSGPVREEVRSPKLSGKGIELINYLARNPQIAADPAIMQFDQTRFDQEQTTANEAVAFARRLFQITNTALPQARVSPTFDCAELSFGGGFRWVAGSGLQ